MILFIMTFYCLDTKFAPDWCFGLVKQKRRRTFISSLFDIARTVEDSATVNVAELVGLHNGSVLIATYDRVAYVGQYFKKLPQIKSFYHFRFDKEHPGTVFCKRYWDSEEKAVNLLRNRNFLPEPAGYQPRTCRLSFQGNPRILPRWN